MPKRHFLQQAHSHADKHPVAGQLASEKLDGMRCWYDGGISRGINVLDIPWANTTKDKKTIYATGLWSRYGKIIYAPDWWLDRLPSFPLDGELHTGRGKFQQTMSFVRKHTPVDSEWQQVNYAVFDSPNLSQILFDSHINQGSYTRDIVGCEQWLDDSSLWNHLPAGITYAQVYAFLLRNLPTQDNIQLVAQHVITSQLELDEFAAQVAALHGEGVILRDPEACYTATRSHSITKLKPYHDDEATVVGYITGRQTDKGSKLLGLMGAMILDYKGQRLELSGFTDKERKLYGYYAIIDSNATEWAIANPETECPDWIDAVDYDFLRGSKITFRYRELSDSLVPKEARYLRPYSE